MDPNKLEDIAVEAFLDDLLGKSRKKVYMEICLHCGEMETDKPYKQGICPECQQWAFKTNKGA